MSKPQYVCKDCGTVGPRVTVVKGHFVVELLLWCCFGVPGLIYTTWRVLTKTNGCGSCGSKNMISVSSPMAKNFMES